VENEDRILSRELSGMRLPAQFHIYVAAIAAALAIAACGERHVQDGPQPKTDTTYKEKLPAGRFQLPTAHTPAPDFFISLPDGYRVKNTGRFPNDEFYIFRFDDPSLRDSAAITPGFMRVYVGVKPQPAYDHKLAHTERHVMIGRSLLTWYMWRETLPDGPTYYSSEIASSDFYASISPELARAPLNLDIYVAGRDSVRVAGLMRAAESLALVP
jgi:hypothetical protein